MEQDFSNNKLRAISGAILLIIALACIVLKYETQSLQIIMVALASFLVGGAMLNKGSE